MVYRDEIVLLMMNPIIDTYVKFQMIFLFLLIFLYIIFSWFLLFLKNIYIISSLYLKKCLSV